MRRAADQAGISASYLSELESARVGLPTSDVASRLDASLGVSATELVVDARAEADRLRAERLRTSGGVAAQTVETDPRQVEAAAALRRDPSLIDVLDYARRLDAPERRAVLALMRELTA